MLVGLLAAAPAAPAATFNVNSTVDLGDANPGNGTCATSGGACTLRAAVQEANALSGPDVVKVPPGEYATNNILVSDAIVIDGAGSGSTVVRMNGLVGRILDVVAGSGSIELRDMTLRDGNADGCGGAVHAIAAVTLRDMVLRDNHARTTSTTACGGAISTGSHPLLVERTQFLFNKAETGTVAAYGGAIDASVPNLTIRDSAFVENRAEASSGGSSTFGGAIFTTATTTLVERSYFVTNFAGSGGGAIDNNNGSMTVRSSTVEANGTGGMGAGIFTGGPLTVENSTFTGNLASGSGGSGGGIYVWDASLTATHMTMAGNLAVGNGAGIVVRNSTATLRASILQNTPADNCHVHALGGTFVSQGFNLEPGTTCGLTGPGDRPATDAQLPPIGANGGPTPTHAIAPGSPAIDMVTSGCPPPATDQRGIARPQGGACDAGAFEYTPEPPAPLPAVDTTPPVLSGVGVTRRRFRAGRRPTAVTARRRRVPAGTTIRFRLSEPALTVLRTQRRTPGVRLRVRGKRRCVRATERNRRRLARQVRSPRLRKRARCVMWPGTGALFRQGVAGVNTVAWSGRIGRRALRPGTYRIAAYAHDNSGNRSVDRISRTFKIVRR